MNAKFLLASAFSLLLVGWTAPTFNHSNLVALSATFDKQGVQPEVQAGKNSDLFVNDQVKRSLNRDSQFAKDFDAIIITTSNGIVTLIGTVSDQNTKTAMERKVANVPGVKSVDNKLEVKQ